jgi:uncharacterized membrane protein YdjX (TVP38/TMEM64 family)
MLEILPRLVETFGELGVAGVALFSATVLIGALVFIPRPLLCFLGGFVYGLAALPVVLAASTTGMIVAFSVSRYLLRPYVERKIETRQKLRAIAGAADAEGWRLVALLRVASPIPGTLMNYALGVTQIRLWHYAGASLLGSALPIAVFIYLGAASQIILDYQSTSKMRFVLMGVGVLVAVFVVWRVGTRARRALAVSLGRKA